ncbi:MAG TPA: response regulator [Arenibacter sp.]|nr:response regulator [Arenibacter sp.]
MRYNCIVVDDEPHAIKILKGYIDSLNQLKIVGSCSNAFEAIHVLTNEKVDLIFLDINMPKLLGTQLLKTLRYPQRLFLQRPIRIMRSKLLIWMLSIIC